MWRAFFQITVALAAWGWLLNPANAYSFSPLDPYGLGTGGQTSWAITYSSDGTDTGDANEGYWFTNSFVASSYLPGYYAIARAKGSLEIASSYLNLHLSSENTNNCAWWWPDPVTETVVYTTDLIFEIVRSYSTEFLPVKANFVLMLHKEGDPHDTRARGSIDIGRKEYVIDADVSKPGYFLNVTTLAWPGDWIEVNLRLDGHSHPGPEHTSTGDLDLYMGLFHYNLLRDFDTFPFPYDSRLYEPLLCEDGEFALLNRITGEITAIPLPPSCWLLASGLLGLGGIAFRRRKSSKS